MPRPFIHHLNIVKGEMLPKMSQRILFPLFQLKYNKIIVLEWLERTFIIVNGSKLFSNHLVVISSAKEKSSLGLFSKMLKFSRHMVSKIFCIRKLLRGKLLEIKLARNFSILHRFFIFSSIFNLLQIFSRIYLKISPIFSIFYRFFPFFTNFLRQLYVIFFRVIKPSVFIE